MDLKDLEPVGIIAFDGAIKDGLHLHPDKKHVIYPMGNKVTIKNINTGKQIALSGHSDVVSAVSVSPCGKYIASGQVTHLGFKATVIIWDYEERRRKSSYEIHKVRIQDLCFTCESNYLLSLGGRDDGNIVVWDLKRSEAMCGSYASNDTAGNALTIASMNIRDLCFMTGGDRTLIVWRIIPETRKVLGMNVKLGKLRRTITCIAVDARDELAYCGTSSGDIIKTRLNYHHDVENTLPAQPPIMVGCYSKIPKNLTKLKEGEGDLYSGGVTKLLLLRNETLVVAAGDGTVQLIELVGIPAGFSSKTVKLPSTPQLRTTEANNIQGLMRMRNVLVKSVGKITTGFILEWESCRNMPPEGVEIERVDCTSIHKTENVRSSVTSMLLDSDSILVGTEASEIYQIRISDFDTRLVTTCHTNAIYDIVFPHNFSEIFATGSKNDIRLWHLESQRELLRITVPNFICTGICFSYCGGMIVTAWNDGIIRAFKPRTGRLKFIIHNAHIKAVSALCITPDGKTLVSGGCDGQIRMWRLSADVQTLQCVLKEHRGSVTSLHMSPTNYTEVISSSTDATCIVWDIVPYASYEAARTLVWSHLKRPKYVRTPGFAQLQENYRICSPTNHVRKQVLMANTMFMSARFSPNGVQIVTCGTDRKVAYWEVLDGSLVREFEGSTAGALNCLDLSPDGRYIVTGSNDCVVKIWGYDSADTTHVGLGHAAIITACRYSPDGKHLVTASADGAIIVWRSPFEPKFETPAPTPRSISTCSLREENWNRINLSDSKRALLDDGVDNFANLVAPNESVRTVHENESDRKDLCNYDPTKPSRDSCDCLNNVEKDTSNEHSSHRSGRSSSSSLRSDKTNRQPSSRQSAISKHDTAKYSHGLAVTTSKSQMSMGDCVDDSKSAKRVTLRDSGTLLSPANFSKTSARDNGSLQSPVNISKTSVRDSGSLQSPANISKTSALVIGSLQSPVNISKSSARVLGSLQSPVNISKTSARVIGSLQTPANISKISARDDGTLLLSPANISKTSTQDGGTLLNPANISKTSKPKIQLSISRTE